MIERSYNENTTHDIRDMRDMHTARTSLLLRRQNNAKEIQWHETTIRSTLAVNCICTQ